MKRSELVEQLVELAGARIDIYYHSSTNTHIVSQKDEVVFSNIPVKGTADFADDAHQDFLRRLGEAALQLDDERLSAAIKRCRSVSPSCSRKFELQVAIRDGISAKVRDRARVENTTLERLIEKLVNDFVPEFSSKADIISWANEVKSVSDQTRDVVLAGVQTASSVALPVTRGEFERMSKVVGSGAFDGFGRLLEDLVVYAAAKEVKNGSLVR